MRNPVRWVAVICVAVTSLYIMIMGYLLNEVLSSPNWCSRAIQADKITPGNKIDVASSCVTLLTIQLKSIATNSHILFGVIALCLLTLIVIVIAGGKLDASGFGAHVGIGRGEATKAAAQTAAAAVDKANDIAQGGVGTNGEDG